MAFHRKADLMMADTEARLAHRLQKRRARLHRVDQQQRGILWALALRCAPFIPIVENDDVLPLLDSGAQIHVNGTGAPERRRGQPTNFATTVEIDEDDFILSGVVG